MISPDEIAIIPISIASQNQLIVMKFRTVSIPVPRVILSNLSRITEGIKTKQVRIAKLIMPPKINFKMAFITSANRETAPAHSDAFCNILIHPESHHSEWRNSGSDHLST